MFCRTFFNNFGRAVKYTSFQCRSFYCLKIPSLQFSDHSPVKASDVISTSQELSAEQDLPPKCSSSLYGDKRNADAELYLNSLSEEMKEKKLQIEFIIESLKTENAMIPEHISAIEMKVMLTEKKASRKSVKRYCRQLCMKNNYRTKRKHGQREKKMKELEERTDTRVVEDSIVCPNHSRQQWEKSWGKVRTLLHGHPVIIDMDYDLTVRDENVLQSELEYFLRWNLNESNPLLLQFTSFHKNSIYSSIVESKHSDNMAAEFYQEKFTDLYPREKLIYLSPDGRPFSKKFDRNKIYIIGGLVEKYSSHTKASYIKAAELGIECRSFPVQHYFTSSQTKGMNYNFSTDVSLKILQNFFNCGNWRKVLTTYIQAPKKAWT